MPIGTHLASPGQSSLVLQITAQLSWLMHNPRAPFGNVQFDRFGSGLFANSASYVQGTIEQCPLPLQPPRMNGPQSASLEQDAIA
jgi:hypothetical protein